MYRNVGWAARAFAASACGVGASSFIRSRDASAAGPSSFRERFEQYASAKQGGERFMKPDDFVRSLFLCGQDTNLPNASTSELQHVFVDMDCGGDGLLSYTEYCLFMTLLTNTREQSKVCFKMFDFENTNAISLSDFKLMIRSLCNDPSVQFDWTSGLAQRWFGESGDTRLRFKKFWGFVRDLKETVIRAEFRVADADCSGEIALADAAGLFISGLTSPPSYLKANARALKRLDPEKYTISEEAWINLSLLSAFVRELREGFDLWTRNGRLVMPADFRRICKAVVLHLDVGDTEIDLLFRLFGEAATGALNYGDMCNVMAQRQALGHPNATHKGPRRNAVQSFFYCTQGKARETFY
eukprot:Hpha_TRINITY_DN35675_c0_g1::TRINITY_DN35675_c0_g1_i1::g.68544::m.68544